MSNAKTPNSGYVMGTEGTEGTELPRGKPEIRPAKTSADGNVVIQLVCKVDKKTRDRYDFPNFTAIHCLRQDLEMYEDGEIGLIEFIDMLQTTYVVNTIVQVSR